MDRRTYYDKQPVTAAELNAGFTCAEEADWRQFTDLGIEGIISGYAITAPPNGIGVTLTVGGTDRAYCQGQRLAELSAGFIGLTNDEAGASTAVVAAGNERIVSVFAKATRAESDPRIDGNLVPVNFVSEEYVEFVVRAGVEAAAGMAVAPALESDGVLLVDVTRTFGQTDVVTGNLSFARRQEYYAAQMDRTGPMVAWARNSVAVPSRTVEDQLAAIIAQLSVQVGTTDGASGVGADEYAIGSATVLTRGTVRSQIRQIADLLELTSGIFGDGVDGNLSVVPGGTLTLTGHLFVQNMYVGAGATVYPNGYWIFVWDTLTMDNGAKIVRNGADGGTGGVGGGTAGVADHNGVIWGGAAGGIGGAPAGNGANGGSIGYVPGAAGAGGDGGAGLSGTAGSGGSVSLLDKHLIAENFRVGQLAHPGFVLDNIAGTIAWHALGGGAGAGGGGGGPFTGGGGGAAGAGVFGAFARRIVATGTVTFQAKGGRGGDGGSGGGAGAGSGGGGRGGTVFCAYLHKSGTITYDVSGGAPGTPSAGGTAGSAGAAGAYFEWPLLI